jgi:Lrp/AsnC family leucine-responsive transcriptional regulator
MDATDKAILKLLASNARRSLKELARSIQLSSPSTSERLHRLEERGVIRAYTIDVNPIALGHSVQAIVRIRPLPGRVHAAQQLVAARAEVVECDKVTGDDCFVARIFATSMDHLDEIVDSIATESTTSTAIVKTQLIQRRIPPVAES